MAEVIQSQLRRLGVDPIEFLYTEAGREFIARRITNKIDDAQFEKCVRNMLIMNPWLRLQSFDPASGQ